MSTSSSSNLDPAADNFWEQAQHKKLNERENRGVPPRSPKRRSRVKLLLIIAAATLIGVGLLIAAAPTIAGYFGPGLVASRSPQYLNGTATVTQTSFSWGGPQRIKGVKVVDVNNNFVASIDSVEVDTSLVSLIRGNLDLGESTIDGVRADIVKRADGKTNVENLAPAPAAQPTPTSKPALPKGLQGTVNLKNTSATFTDETTRGVDGKATTASLKDFNATAQFGVNQPLKVSAKGNTTDAATTGSINIEALIQNWTDASGTLTPQTADVDATVAIKSLPVALVDAFAPGLIKGGSMKTALGDTADINITAKGNAARGKGDITAISPNAQASAKLTLADNVVTNDAPIQVRISSKGVEGFVPTLRDSLNQTNVKFESLPDASVTIDNLRFALAPKDKPLSYVGSGATIIANISEMRGTVVMQKDAAPSPFRVAPLAATIDAKDLSKTVRITAATDAQINGNNAGTLNADILIDGLLDNAGALIKGTPGNIRGEVAMRGVSTLIAQPFVQALKLDLPNDVGPTLDAQVTLATDLTAPAPAGAKGAPPADVNFRIQSQYLAVNGALRYAADRITAKDTGIRIEAARAAAMAGRFLSPDTGFAILSSRNDAKGVIINILSLDIPRNANGDPDASKIAASMAVDLDGVAILPVTQIAGAVRTAGQPLDVQKLNIVLAAGNQGSIRGNLDGSLWHESKPFTIKGTFDLANALTNDKEGKLVANLEGMKPTAKIDITNLPATIARFALPGRQPSVNPAVNTQTSLETQPLDLVKLLDGLAGPTFNVAINAANSGGKAGSYTLDTAVRSERLSADLNAQGDSKKIDVKTVQAKANVTPQTVRGLIETFAPAVQGSPQLASPSTLTFTVQPFTIPLKENKPDFAAITTPALAKITLPGRTLVSGLTRKDDKGTPVDLGTFGLQDFQIDAILPIAAFLGPVAADRRAATLTLAGSILGGPDAGSVVPIGVLAGNIVAQFSDKQPVGPLAIKLKIDRIDTAAVERIAGMTGLVSGAIGDSAAIVLDADVQPGGNPGEPANFAQATTNAKLQINAPKLQSSGPLAATISPAAIALTAPSKLTLNVDPQWATRMFLTPPAQPDRTGQPASPPSALALRAIAPVNITLDKLYFPFKGAPAATAKLEAALSLAIASMALTTSDGKNVTLGATTIQVKSRPPGPTGTPIDFNLAVTQIAVGDGSPASDMTLAGTIDNIISPAGVVDPARAVVNTRADLPKIPTALIDAFTTKDGTVIDALGPLASLKLNVERYPLNGQPASDSQPPVIDIVANSDRASATLRGTVRDGLFISEAPLSARVTRVTPELSARFIKALPILGTFEKTAEDAPALLEIVNITAPLGSDPAKLNADITFDPGEARYGTSAGFGELLKIINSRTDGQVGKKLEPLTMQVRSGVATYKRWRVPLGEFIVETEGTVNLVSRTVDVITYVPVGAVSDRVSGSLGGAGGLGKILPGVVDAASTIPFRTTGPMDNPVTRVDPELLARNAVKAIDPEKLIKDGIGDLFKKRPPQAPTPPK